MRNSVTENDCTSRKMPKAQKRFNMVEIGI